MTIPYWLNSSARALSKLLRMDIIKNRNTFLIIAAIVIAGSLGIVLTLGLKLGIDFAGGSLTEVSYDARPDKAGLEADIAALDLGGTSLRESIDESGRDGFILRTRDLEESERITVEGVLEAAGEGGDVVRFTSIGPVIGEELKSKAVWAIAGVVIVIILYVAIAFARVGKPVSSWIYGGITILALLHDVLVPTAVAAIMGAAFAYEIDVLFVMALLAVLGYSVNDTIVVFDRVRENLIKYRQEKKIKIKEVGGMEREEIEYVYQKPFADVVGMSVDQTIMRSINTSVTTLLALSALYIIGSEVTQDFALILIAGVIAGTYSSIFLANPLLVYYAEKYALTEEKKDEATNDEKKGESK